VLYLRGVDKTMKSTRVGSCYHMQSVLRHHLVLLLVGATLVLTACSGGPPPKLYLLEAPAIDTADQAAEASSLDALGISQVIVPGYASDARIASVEADGVVIQSNGQRWAEEPEESITRLLANRLRQRASATVWTQAIAIG